ncbi:hypothetical protein [Nocardioides sp. GY 10127]|uniref:hypothetical protein n=1 Tax=Nocardioides sp. GY 10127 TaxID=2569762 RepID=UPI0010A8AA92|nr:hypothetical protein [Nocardioides sp. GY 10127]TIC82769.1 hypothetical protein E8D37_08760 [Nocardioides sp. GY 10127]
MKDLVLGLSKKTINVIFGGIYAVAALMALFPPLYLWASGSDVKVLGIPWAIGYWIFVWLLVCAALVGLYNAERIRGEFDEEVSA